MHERQGDLDGRGWGSASSGWYYARLAYFVPCRHEIAFVWTESNPDCSSTVFRNIVCESSTANSSVCTILIREAISPALRLQPTSRRCQVPRSIPQPRLASNPATLPSESFHLPSPIQPATHRSGNSPPWPHTIKALKASPAAWRIDFPRVSS